MIQLLTMMKVDLNDNIKVAFVTYRENHAVPNDFLAIDETLYSLKIKVHLKECQKSKPAQCGTLFIKWMPSVFHLRFLQVSAWNRLACDGPYYYTSTVLDWVNCLVNSMQWNTSVQGQSIKVLPINWFGQLAAFTKDGKLQINRKGITYEIKHLSSPNDISYQVYRNNARPTMTLHSYVACTKSGGKRNVLPQSLEQLLTKEKAQPS